MGLSSDLRSPLVATRAIADIAHAQNQPVLLNGDSAREGEPFPRRGFSILEWGKSGHVQPHHEARGETAWSSLENRDSCNGCYNQAV